METEPPSPFVAIFFAIPSSWDFMGIVFLLGLLAFSAMASGSEVAFFSLTRKDLDEAKDAKRTGWNEIQMLLANKKQLLATILILNNAINIAIVLLAAYLSSVFIHPLIAEYRFIGISLSVVFDIVVITFLLLLFGEIIPKIYAGKQSYAFASRMRKMILVSRRMFYPISGMLLGMSNALEKRLSPNTSISVDQLSQALELTQEDNATTDEEQKILEGIVSFGGTETRQIMTPRVDMFALRNDKDFESVIQLIAKNGFSRVPVFGENIDQIEGVLYAKDLIPHLPESDFEWTSLLREAFFVPEKKKLNDLLADFQEKKIHLAIVVDEYGGVQGVVSLEDVIEEIVGDISDEFDDDDVQYSKLDDQNYVFEGKTSIKDFSRIMDIDSDFFDEISGEVETIAGLVLEISDQYPNKRQVLSFKNMDFTIEALDKRRIKSIKVTRNEDAK